MTPDQIYEQPETVYSIILSQWKSEISKLLGDQKINIHWHLEEDKDQRYLFKTDVYTKDCIGLPETLRTGEDLTKDMLSIRSAFKPNANWIHASFHECRHFSAPNGMNVELYFTMQYMDC